MYDKGMAKRSDMGAVKQYWEQVALTENGDITRASLEAVKPMVEAELRGVLGIRAGVVSTSRVVEEEGYGL